MLTIIIVNNSADSENQHNTLKYLCRVNNALEDEVAGMDKNFVSFVKSVSIIFYIILITIANEINLAEF